MGVYSSDGSAKRAWILVAHLAKRPSSWTTAAQRGRGGDGGQYDCTRECGSAGTMVYHISRCVPSDHDALFLASLWGGIPDVTLRLTMVSLCQLITGMSSETLACCTAGADIDPSSYGRCLTYTRCLSPRWIKGCTTLSSIPSGFQLLIFAASEFQDSYSGSSLPSLHILLFFYIRS